jgi:hypothetical protein
MFGMKVRLKQIVMAGTGIILWGDFPPELVIDDKVKCVGQVPADNDILAWLKKSGRYEILEERHSLLVIYLFLSILRQEYMNCTR